MNKGYRHQHCIFRKSWLLFLLACTLSSPLKAQLQDYYRHNHNRLGHITAGLSTDKGRNLIYQLGAVSAFFQVEDIAFEGQVMFRLPAPQAPEYRRPWMDFGLRNVFLYYAPLKMGLEATGAVSMALERNFDASGVPLDNTHVVAGLGLRWDLDPFCIQVEGQRRNIFDAQYQVLLSYTVLKNKRWKNKKWKPYKYQCPEF